MPENWDIQPGWIKYHYEADGSSYSEHVPYPMHDGKPEQLLAFDVETMPKYHLFPIMACAASPNAWYAWISPWILDPSIHPDHPIPLGPPHVPRVVVGHNVSYDRARVKEEYHIDGTGNRFIDTMALHIAVKGISSNQRPAWMKHKKNKEEENDRKVETVEAVMQLMGDAEAKIARLEAEGSKKSAQELQKLREFHQDAMQSLPRLRETLRASTQNTGESVEDSTSGVLDDDEIVEAAQKRWEDVTSANSLRDVAKLYCDLDVSKEIRNDFMECTPEEILVGITDYLGYCASDVSVTHQVFQKALPEFLVRCPHPVSFAGILTMGSGFLPVNQEWERYLERAEGVYKKLDNEVKENLATLAKDAMQQQQSSILHDPWLSQLDWTPKLAGKTRGIAVDENDQSPVVSYMHIVYSCVCAYGQSGTHTERLSPAMV